jgi:hypothetical protein
VVNNSKSKYFSLTALSCPYGQKLKIHVKNLAKAPSVVVKIVHTWADATAKKQSTNVRYFILVQYLD